MNNPMVPAARIRPSENAPNPSPIARSGKKAIKQVTIKVFHIGGKGHNTYRHRAPNGKCFLESGLEGLLAHTAARLEELLPDEEYALVDLGGGCFNFVWKGKKAEVAE